MRFSCQVQVINYKMPGHGHHTPPISKRSTLTLGGYSGSGVGGKLWILHQNAQNGAGIRYKVNSNIVKMHIKFLHEGKMTIRLKEPTVDLRISGEPAEITKFAKMIGDFSSGKPLPAVAKIANLETVSKKMEPPPKKYLAILDKKELQLIKNGYPTSLNELVISNVGMNVVDPKIFRLPHLKILRLECNQISRIPRSIELLSGLTQLYLKGNCLGQAKHIEDWEWLRCKPLQSSLKVLDLSSNQLETLPDSLAHLQGLSTLKLDDNALVRLPNNLGFAKNLSTLSLRKNELQWIPASLIRSAIQAIDLSENRFRDITECTKQNLQPNLFLRTSAVALSSIALKDLAARVVLHHRLEYNETSLPRELMRYLDGACYCICGQATYPASPSQFMYFPASTVWSCVTYDQGTIVVVGTRKCVRCASATNTLGNKRLFNLVFV